MENVTRLRAVVFDFDGTLARPVLDFPLMKRRIGELGGNFPCGVQQPGPLPALEWIEGIASGLGGPQGGRFRLEAYALIEEMEREAAARSGLFPFVRSMLERLLGQGIGVGVITRNCRAAVEQVFPDAMDLLPVLLTREDVAAVKPDPEHLLQALGALGVAPGQALMVGDHPLDVLTARRAGAYAGAVASGESAAEALAETGPDFLAADAGELMTRLHAGGSFL